MSYQHCNGKHDLRDISYRRDGTPGVVRMTRWCANCGAIVIDVDVDGRTQPGAGMPMRFPRIAASGVAPTRNITSLAEFCAEGERLGLTAADLVEPLSKRPEFADCLPNTGVAPSQAPSKMPGEIPGCNRGNLCPWGEESAPDWRSVCRACGRRAAGSGQ